MRYFASKSLRVTLNQMKANCELQVSHWQEILWLFVYGFMSYYYIITQKVNYMGLWSWICELPFSYCPEGTWLCVCGFVSYYPIPQKVHGSMCVCVCVCVSLVLTHTDLICISVWPMSDQHASAGIGYANNQSDQ